MLSDARELAADQQVEVDVCIVGAGPAGIALAREFVSNGARVWLLESGGKDVERRSQQLNRGQSVGYPIHRPHQSRVRAASCQAIASSGRSMMAANNTSSTGPRIGQASHWALRILVGDRHLLGRSHGFGVG